jgi:hypothetical protein
MDMIIPSGIWQTDGGSTLKLIMRDGLISGSYSTIHGQPEIGEEVAITGMVNGDLVGFVASWGKYKSMTSWCGKFGYDKERACIRTVWHLARDFADKGHTMPNDYWESFLTYTGTYYLVETL